MIKVSFQMRGFGATVRQFAEIVPVMAEETSKASGEAVLEVQRNVVPRIPVDSGQTRDAFADADAIGQDANGVWQYGLLTDELVRRGYRGKWIEYGTKGAGPYPAQPARPFVRPGSEASHAEMQRLYREAVNAAIKRQAETMPRQSWLAAFDDSASSWRHAAFIESFKEGLGLGPKLD